MFRDQSEHGGAGRKGQSLFRGTGPTVRVSMKNEIEKPNSMQTAFVLICLVTAGFLYTVCSDIEILEFVISLPIMAKVIFVIGYVGICWAVIGLRNAPGD